MDIDRVEITIEPIVLSETPIILHDGPLTIASSQFALHALRRPPQK